MPVHVRFRFNKLTGEVEEFLVDDQNRQLSEAEHERIADDVGRMLCRRPRVNEVTPLAQQPQPIPRPVPTPGETSTREQPSESTSATETLPQRLTP